MQPTPIPAAEANSAAMARDAMIKLRITVDEQTAWQAAAELEQMSLSAWIRRRCNGLAATAPAVIVPSSRARQQRKRRSAKAFAAAKARK